MQLCSLNPKDTYTHIVMPIRQIRTYIVFLTDHSVNEDCCGFDQISMINMMKTFLMIGIVFAY